MLRILHLSDLHFGPQSRFKDTTPEHLASVLGASVRQYLQNNAPDLVIITGDMVFQALPIEYAEVTTFLTSLEKSLKISRERFILLPGNHDVSRKFCKRIEEDLRDEKKFSEEVFCAAIQVKKLSNYNDFFDSFMENAQDSRIRLRDVHGPLLVEYPELGVAIATFNSNHAESHRDTDHVGDLDPIKVKKVMDYWRDGSKKHPPLRIVALHHNLDGKMEGWLKQLAGQCQVCLILHGHEHKNKNDFIPWNEGGTHLLAAGSLGVERSQREEEYPNTCRIITIEGTKFAVQSLVYDSRRPTPGEFDLGGWGKDPSEDKPYANTLHGGCVSQQVPPNSLDIETHHNDEDTAFLRRYRAQLAGLFDRWDLRHAGTAAAGPSQGKAIDATLEQMY
ncbi:MAG: metallophosphoesterase [Magnetococcales bacterium]|nr:metallophosphoesterase [Magnetococcales bacterium]